MNIVCLNCVQMESRILGESTIETRHWQLLSSRQEEKAGIMNFSEKGSPSVSELKDWIPFGPVKSRNNPTLIADPPWNLWPLFLERRIQKKNRSHMLISRHSSVIPYNTEWMTSIKGKLLMRKMLPRWRGFLIVNYNTPISTSTFLWHTIVINSKALSIYST